jgi:hypothetical protein
MAYRLIPGGYIDETGPHRGVPPSEDDQVRISLALHHRLLFGPYDMEFSQQMTIEEVEKRWPNALIPGEENGN